VRQREAQALKIRNRPGIGWFEFTNLAPCDLRAAAFWGT